MKWIFIVFCVYLGTLFFRTESIPGKVFLDTVGFKLPENIKIEVESVDFGFKDGILIRGFKVYDFSMADHSMPMAEAKQIRYSPLRHEVQIDGAKYPRLPDSYYAPGNLEKNARVEMEFPVVAPFRLILRDSEILGLQSALVISDVEVAPRRVDFQRIKLTFPDRDVELGVTGFCYVDIDRQEVKGEIIGTARQPNIRPLLVDLDIPVSLPYFDAFTEVTKPVPSRCGWQVNLENNDFDLWLDLSPTMGRYNGVPMKWADGKIHLHPYTRGTWLNYRTTVGPINAEDIYGRSLKGTVSIEGTNGYNTVRVDCESGMPVADILKIGGFSGKYVNDDVIGNAKGKLEFRFPRAMTNNYEVLDGEGHITIEDGHLNRLRIFAGLTKMLAEKVPGISVFTDQSNAEINYRIERGVVKMDRVNIKGDVFSIDMKGQFDAVKDELDFIVRVEIFRNESIFSTLATPITWTFSKLLLESKLTGSASNPQWSYISVIDRILGVTK